MEKISLRLSSPCLLSHLGLKVVLQPSHFRCLLKGENNGGRGVGATMVNYKKKKMTLENSYINFRD